MWLRFIDALQLNHGIALVVGQREEIDLTLQVGDVHQTVEVPANSGVIQITTEDISGLVGERQVKDLPLNGRSYDQLLTLNPGIINYTSQRAGGIGTSNSVVGNMFAVSGRRPQENPARSTPCRAPADQKYRRNPPER